MGLEILIFQIRFKENTAILTHDLLYLNVIGNRSNQIITERARDRIFGQV